MEPTREVQKGLGPQPEYLFIRGMDSFTDPTFIGARQYRVGWNVVNRGGIVQCRPGYRSLLTLPTGRLQGAKLFTPTRGKPHLVVAVDGKIYSSQAPFTSYTQVPGLSFRRGVANIYFADCQKVVVRNTDGSLTTIDPYRVLVIQDGGYTRAGFWDGANSGHLDPSGTGAQQTPSGGVMKWAGDRLWVARGPQLFASDIGDPLSFSENEYLAEGQPLLFPSDITAMEEISSSTNPYLFVATEQDGHVVQSSIRDRSKWKTTDQFQAPLTKTGCVGHRAITSQYGLVWWYSPSGLLSLDSSALSNVSSKLHYRDIEMAVSKSNISRFQHRIALASVENFLLVSVPSGDGYNRHTWVRDNSAADLSESESGPAWSSVWTGTRPVEWCTGKVDGTLRAFFVSRDFDGQNRLWEAFRSDQMDDGSPIDWSVTTKAHAGDGVNPSEFRFAELYTAQVKGQVNLSVSYAGPYRGPWKKLLDTTIRAARGGVSATTNLSAGSRIRNLRAQTRTIRTPEGAVDRGVTTPEGETAEHIDFSFQLKLSGSGPGGLRGYKLYTVPFKQSATGSPPSSESTSFAVDVLGAVADGSVLAPPTVAGGSSFFSSPLELRAEDSDYRSV